MPEPCGHRLLHELERMGGALRDVVEVLAAPALYLRQLLQAAAVSFLS